MHEHAGLKDKMLCHFCLHHPSSSFIILHHQSSSIQVWQFCSRLPQPWTSASWESFSVAPGQPLSSPLRSSRSFRPVFLRSVLRPKLGLWITIRWSFQQGKRETWSETHKRTNDINQPLDFLDFLDTHGTPFQKTPSVFFQDVHDVWNVDLRPASLCCSPLRRVARASGTPVRWPHPFAHRRASMTRWRWGTNGPARPGRIPWEGHCRSNPRCCFVGIGGMGWLLILVVDHFPIPY